MSFVLKSEHVAPTGTKVMPIALTQKELLKMQSEAKQIKVSQASAEKR
jgi:cell division protein FtsI (penicillin-binding protein 3)